MRWGKRDLNELISTERGVGQELWATSRWTGDLLGMAVGRVMRDRPSQEARGCIYR